MSTIKSSAENLTLNADGANNDIKFQSNGSEVASIDQAGVMTATSFAGSGANLTGVGVDGISSSANATAMTIDSAENIGIGTTPESGQGSNSQGLYVGTHASLTSNGAYESVNLSENAYLATAASDTWKYRDTSHAARHEMKAGVHTLKVAASGTADADITWTNAMTINNAGAVAKPNQPSFWVSGTAAGGMVSYASNAEIVFSNAQSNTGSHYNTSTGRFTAPVAGAYLFSGTLQGTKASNYRWTIKKNNVQFGSGGANSDCVPHGYNVDVGQTTNTIVLQLAANDYVSCSVRTGQAMAVYGGHSYFSGVLVG